MLELRSRHCIWVTNNSPAFSSLETTPVVFQRSPTVLSTAFQKPSCEAKLLRDNSLAGFSQGFVFPIDSQPSRPYDLITNRCCRVAFPSNLILPYTSPCEKQGPVKPGRWCRRTGPLAPFIKLLNPSVLVWFLNGLSWRGMGPGGSRPTSKRNCDSLSIPAGRFVLRCPLAA